jgi:hypothetical protein
MTPDQHPGAAAPLDAHVLGSLIGEFRKLKKLGDGALAQIPSDEALNASLDPESNSLTVLVRHLAGNMRSRWTDFFTTDGEKPNRNRDGEFEPEIRLTREEALAEWENGWSIMLTAMDALSPSDLQRLVTIRGEAMTAFDAMTRALSHTAQHVGQIMMLAKHAAGPRWQTLTIPRRRPASSR